MGRPRKCPEFDSDKVMKELSDLVCGLYEENGELKRTAEEIGLSPLKVRKILVTAGVYENDIAAEVNELFQAGKTPVEIQEIAGLGRSSVNGYLPYVKAPYKTAEVSLNAERIRVYRDRQACVKRLQASMGEDALWDAVVAFQRYSFKMVGKKLPFLYVMKVGKNGICIHTKNNRMNDTETLINKVQ